MRARSRPVPLAVALLVSVCAGAGAGTVSVGGHTADAASVPAGFSDVLVASASSPTAVESLPDGRIVVLEQGGRVRVASPGQAFTTVLDLGDVCATSERGLLGFTHDPGFLTNRRVYVYATRQSPEGCVNRVSRFEMPNAIDPASEVVLLDRISSINGNHNAGDLEVGSDGYLYVSTGDAGRDPRGDSGSAGANDAARDRSLLNGKILRITLDGAPAPGNPLSVPGSEQCAFRGNTASTPATFCQEIYAWGLRNPFRFAWDPNGGGDRFFVNDVGQGTREEVDEGGIGRDYGWNVCEGPCSPAVPGLTDPVTSYPRSVGTYVTGGAFVPDGLWPAELDGAYLFGDGGTGKIFVRYANGSVDFDQPWATGAGGIADMTFAFDENGRLALYYTLAYAGQVRKITWTGAAPAAPSSLAFDAITPTRVYDTRNGIGVVTGDVRAGTTRLVRLDPPDPGVRAALVNVTVTNNAGWGFVQAWTPRSPRPATSVVNTVRPGEDVANAAVVTLDDQGRFVLQVAMGTDVVVDVQGWFRTTPGSSGRGRLVPVEPSRRVDTRQTPGTVLSSGSDNPYVQTPTATGSRVVVPLTDRAGVPGASQVSAVAFILTALGAGGAEPGYVTAAPSGVATPPSSNVNTLGGGDIRANLVVVPVGADGSVALDLVRVDDVLVDVVGYFTSATAPTSGVGLFTPVPSVRVFDERQPGAPAAPGGGSLVLDVASAVPGGQGASAVLQNLTMTNTTGFDYVSAFPAGGGVPEVSNVNATGPGQTRAAAAITRIGAGGDIGYFSFATSDLVVDVFGVFSS